MSSTMQALRLHDKGDIRLDTVPIPQCDPDKLRVQVAFCGICGSDIHEYMGGPIIAPAAGETNPYTGASLPVIMGHEISGTIVELGTKVEGFQVGQKVVVNPLVADFEHGTKPCLSCLAGRSNTCKRAAYYGLSVPGGGFSKQLIVNPSNLVCVPETLSLKTAALSEPLAVAWHMIRKSGFVTGQSVLILGAGPIGLALLMILRSKGAGKILVSEVSSLRIQQAREFGADRVINPLEETSTVAKAGGIPSNPVIEAVHEVTEEGVDLSFDASGFQATLDTAIASVRPGGTIFNVAIHEKSLLINLNDLSVSEKFLTGGICYTKEDFENVLSYLVSNSNVADKMISSIVPLADIIHGGFLELINNKTKHVKILIQVSNEHVSLRNNFLGLDYKAGAITLTDDGECHFSTTTFDQSALALNRILHTPAPRLPRFFLSNFATIQKEPVETIERLTGEKWQRKSINTAETIPALKAAFQNGETYAGYGLINIGFTKGTYSGHFEPSYSTRNKELGLPEMILEQVVRGALAEAGHHGFRDMK